MSVCLRHIARPQNLSALAIVLTVGCGKVTDQLAPTSDELRAAQLGAQAAGDGAAAVGPSPSQAGSARAAAVTPMAKLADLGVGINFDPRFGTCLDAASRVGQGLAASAAANLGTRLGGNVDVSASTDTEASEDLQADGHADLAAATETDTSGRTLVLVFSPAACTFGGAALAGGEIVQIQPSGRIQVVAGLQWKLAGGDVLKVSSTDSARPTYELVGVTDPNTDTYTVLLNEHRVRTNAAGTVKFDVATKTADASGLTVIQETSAATEASAAAGAQASASAGATSRRTVKAGSIVTTHAAAGFDATQTFTGLAFDTSGACGCPVSGTLQQEVVASDKSRTATHVYAFTACGRASVRSTVRTSAGEASGQAQIAFDDCGG